MIDYQDLAASTPPDEPCIQLGHEDYSRLARLEARAYIDQIIRTSPPPESCSLRIRSNPHDFGSYLSVAVYYNTEIEESVGYAFDCEEEPTEWDEVAKAWLKEHNYPFEEAVG